jgi:hypothetical protein
VKAELASRRADGVEEMRGERRDVKHGIVKLLVIRLGKPDHDATLSLGAHIRDPPEEQRALWIHGGIAAQREREDHVACRDRHPVVPPRPWVELEDEGQRVPPAPRAGELRLEALVAGGDQRRAEPRQRQKRSRTS